MFSYNNFYNTNLFFNNMKNGINTNDIDTNFILLFSQMYSTCLARIKWNNLPINISSDFIEKTLLDNEVCVFFYDDILEKYLVTNVELTGKFNIEEIPTNYKAIANNGYRRELNPSNSVLIFNKKYSLLNDIAYIDIYAKRISNILDAYLTNIDFQRTPLIVKSNDNTILSNKNLVKKWIDKIKILYLKDNFDINTISTLNFNVPFMADKLYTIIKNELSDFYNLMGIESNNIDKKERLVVTESMGNLGAVELNRNKYLNSRNESIEKINKMFNLNISCEFNSDLPTPLNLGLDFNLEGEEVK